MLLDILRSKGREEKKIQTLCSDTFDPVLHPTEQTTPPIHQRFFLDLFAGHSAPLTVAAKAAGIYHLSPFDLEFDHLCEILDDTQFENLLQLAHSGLIGAIWSAPPCKFYSQLRQNDGGPPPLRSKDYLDGLPSLTPQQLLQVQESKEIHRRSSILCIAGFQQGGFAGQEQPINSLAWCEAFHQQFLSQCSCHFVATPACRWGLDWYKTLAIAATSDRIKSLAAHCNHTDHQDFRGKRLPDGSYISALTVEYPSKLAHAIIDIIKPWVSSSTSSTQSLSTWKSLLSKKPLEKGPRITDGAGNDSSANWTIPSSHDTQSCRKRWISRILHSNLHTRIMNSCRIHQAEPFLSDDGLIPLLQDLQSEFPSHNLGTSILPFQPFRLQIFHSLLQLTQDPDPTIALHLQQGIPSGAFAPLQPVGLWEPNDPPDADRPGLEICQDNWKSANQDPATTRCLIQQEKDAGFIEEISSITEAERRWPKGIA